MLHLVPQRIKISPVDLKYSHAFDQNEENEPKAKKVKVDESHSSHLRHISLPSAITNFASSIAEAVNA
jgi:hypothetical protein